MFVSYSLIDVFSTCGYMFVCISAMNAQLGRIKVKKKSIRFADDLLVENCTSVRKTAMRDVE